MALTKLKNFIAESARVFRVTKKPTKEEYLTIVKVSGIGVLVIGLIGFVLQMIDQTVSLLAVAVLVIILVVFLMLWKKKN